MGKLIPESELIFADGSIWPEITADEFKGFCLNAFDLDLPDMNDASLSLVYSTFRFHLGRAAIEMMRRNITALDEDGEISPRVLMPRGVCDEGDPTDMDAVALMRLPNEGKVN